MKKLLAVLSCLPLLLLALGCRPAQDVPVETLQAFLTAFVNKDENTISTLVCKEWESQAFLEYDSFGNVATQLDDLSCKLIGQTKNAQGETVYMVNCTGSISASYGGELSHFDLSSRMYQVIDRGGSLQVCGY